MSISRGGTDELDESLNRISLGIDALADERDRLRAINAELLEALRKIADGGPDVGAHACPGYDCAMCHRDYAPQIARAAIAKAEGK